MTFRPRMNARTDLNRPLLPAGLAGGDILFKHASDGGISQQIRKGQAPHYQAATQTLLEAASKGEVKLQEMPAEAEATDITHVAVAAGPDDVLEFDEGGASKWEIVTKSGRGFVRGRMYDWTATVTHCGRICYKRRKINLSHVFAGQDVGVKQVNERIWLVHPKGDGVPGGIRARRPRRDAPMAECLKTVGGCRRLSAAKELASPMPASWNQIAGWLKQIDSLRHAA